MKKHILTLFLLLATVFASYAQSGNNTATEIIDYRVVDGKIIVAAMVNGVMGDFVLDLSGQNAIMKSQIEKYKIDSTVKSKALANTQFKYRSYSALSTVVINNVSIGNTASSAGASFYLIKDEPYLKELGVIGTVGASIFSKYVFTLDTERKKITLTAPYRPPYMKLDYRMDGNFDQGSVTSFNVVVDNVPCKVMLDTWNSAVLSLISTDYTKLSVGKKSTTGGKISSGFGKNENSLKQFLASSVALAKSEIKDVTVVENGSLKISTVGLNFLQNGIISIDFLKSKIYFQPHGLVAIDDSVILPEEVVIEDGKMNPISAKFFKEKIFDYTKGGEFKSKSDKIYVIDFWAKWCGPCMKMMPQMEALAAKYKGKVIFCKVDADKEKELCNAFTVEALPTLFFIPAGGKPIIEIGAKIETFNQIIERMLNSNSYIAPVSAK